LLKTIKIKKRGGGTRLQKVKVLASGKYRFVKNTTKGMVRKTRKAGRLAYEKTKRKIKRKTSQPKAKSYKRKKSTSSMKMPTIPTWLKKVFLGVGAAGVATVTVGTIAPQYVPIVRPAAAVIAGGWQGLIAELVLNSGILDRITGMFNGGGINQTRLAGGL